MSEDPGWAKDTVLSFLKDVEGLPILWDPKNPQYKIFKRKNDIWSQLAKKYNCPLEDLKRRWQVLEITFKREKTKEAISSGEYKSQWFAYPYMNFVGDRYKPRVLQPVVEKCDAVQINEKTKLVASESNQDSTEEESDEDDSSSDEDDENEEEDEDDDDEIQVTEERRPTIVPVNPEPRTYVPSSPSIVPCAKRTRIESQESVGMGNILTRPIHFFTRSTQSDFSERNEYSIFGEYVAKKLIKMDDKLCAIVQHEIQNILFKAEMGLYTNCSFTFEVNGACSEPGSSPNPAPSSTSHPHVGFKSN